MYHYRPIQHIIKLFKFFYINTSSLMRRARRNRLSIVGVAAAQVRYEGSLYCVLHLMVLALVAFAGDWSAVCTHTRCCLLGLKARTDGHA